MFSQIFDAIEEWMRELLTGMITSNLDTMFTDVNQKTGEIATQVGQTPQGWNGSIFSMIRNLSDSVIMPIAGIIITLVLCYELISMLTERNNIRHLQTRYLETVSLSFRKTEPLWHHVRQPYHSYIQPDMQSDLQLQMEQRS